ncbi:MAG TPA: hydrogenase maturation nickel metallochaperone HypA [Tepidisphaeraceae bacterium]|jgi:hydrogenase nickel incorporation protein HypA/HybF|nr:hydrogenase maturation nickel metallochaperone HypA [Tepidisphaeraceae bacterium]
MHELSIAMSILEAVEEEAGRHLPAKVTAVHLKIGPLSGVVPSALISAFELITENTEFRICRMVIEETPILIHCPTCRTERSVESIQQMSCTVCGTATADVASGRELDVCAMEICE